MVLLNRKHILGKLLLETKHLPKRKTDESSFILRPSKIEGVGVSTTCDIGKGVFLELFPGAKTRFITYAQFKKLNPLEKNFCTRYGVEDENGIHFPKNFSKMEIGWYLNHGNKPNAHRDGNYDYFASRNIKGSEEIIIDYREL